MFPSSVIEHRIGVIMLSKTINFARQMLSEHLQSAYVHSPLTSTQMSLLQLSTYAYYCARCMSHTVLMYIHANIHCEKRRVSLTKLWSPQLHLCGHLHMVSKEHAHKCNPYFDPLVSQMSKREVQLDHDSQFQVSRRCMQL